MWLRSSTRWLTACKKYHSRVQGETDRTRKAFRSRSGPSAAIREFECRGEASVGALFEKIPALRPLYKVRLRFKEIFDTARDNHGRAG